MSLTRFLLRRLLLTPFVILGVAFISFVIGRLVVADPVRAWIGEKASEETAKIMIERYHLKDPIPVSFYYYLINLFTGDWGISPVSGQPVLPTIISHIPATIELSLFAMLLIIIIGIPLGILSAVHKEKLPDHNSRILALIGMSSPPFLIALFLQLTFYYQFRIFPSGSRLDPSITPPPTLTGLFLVDSLLAGDLMTFIISVKHIFLPALTLALLNIGTIVRLVRSTMLDVLDKDYIKTARAKGLKERVVIYKHALRNAMIPTTTVLAMQLGAMLGGSIVVETVFGWPGIGRFAVESVLNLDYPSIIGISIVFALAVVITNLIADLFYTFLDPRIKVD
jgi:peptide/nickel transport system permease protein